MPVRPSKNQSSFNNERLRKERASPLNTVALKMLKNQYFRLYKKYSAFAKSKGLKQQKTLKNPCMILKLIYSYLSNQDLYTQEEIIERIFSKVDGNLDQEIESSYQNRALQEKMKQKCHSDLKTIRSAFSCDLNNLNQIFESLRPLYDRQIVDQPQHSQNRRLLALVIQKYSLIKVNDEEFEILELEDSSNVQESRVEPKSDSMIRSEQSDHSSLVETSLLQRKPSTDGKMIDERDEMEDGLSNIRVPSVSFYDQRVQRSGLGDFLCNDSEILEEKNQNFNYNFSNQPQPQGLSLLDENYDQRVQSLLASNGQWLQSPSDRMDIPFEDMFMSNSSAFRN